jgi:hypothetical protein
MIGMSPNQTTGIAETTVSLNTSRTKHSPGDYRANRTTELPLLVTAVAANLVCTTFFLRNRVGSKIFGIDSAALHGALSCPPVAPQLSKSDDCPVGVCPWPPSVSSYTPFFMNPAKLRLTSSLLLLEQQGRSANHRDCKLQSPRNANGRNRNRKMATNK